MPGASRRRPAGAGSPLLLAALLLGLPAAAQSPPDAGRLLDETRGTNRALQPPPPAPTLVEPPARPTAQMPEGLTVEVTGFRISGATSFSDARLAELVEPWTGKRLDLAGLNEAAGAITRFYQAAGHLLSYAYVPEQRVADGVIELAVLEGRLDDVQVVTAQDVRLRDEVVQAHTEPLVAARPVLQDAVERRLLLLNDIPGVAARAAFTPGAAPGAADMVVTVAEDEPLALRVEADNHGSRATGEYRVGLALQLRDLSGWGDSTQAHVLVSQAAGLVSGSMASQLPLGGDGLKVGVSLSHLTYALSGSFQSLGAVGNADALGVELQYAVWRGSQTNLALRAELEARRLADQIQLIASDNPKHDRLLTLGANFDRRDSLAGGGVTAAALALTFGSLELRDASFQQQDTAGLQTAGGYRKAVVQVARQQSLVGPFGLFGRLLGQGTDRNLDSSQKLDLGGATGVRAYAPGEATVDQGGLATIELRYSLDYLGGNLMGSLFHDRGFGRINHRPLAANAGSNTANLYGSGFGLQWNRGDFGLSASLAWRGSRVPTADGGDPRPRLYLQMFAAP